MHMTAFSSQQHELPSWACSQLPIKDSKTGSWMSVSSQGPTFCCKVLWEWTWCRGQEPEIQSSPNICINSYWVCRQVPSQKNFRICHMETCLLGDWEGIWDTELGLNGDRLDQRIKEDKLTKSSLMETDLTSQHWFWKTREPIRKGKELSQQTHMGTHAGCFSSVQWRHDEFPNASINRACICRNCSQNKGGDDYIGHLWCWKTGLSQGLLLLKRQ